MTVMDLLLSPLTDDEVYERCDRLCAEIGRLGLFVEYVLPDPDTTADKTATAARLREQRMRDLKVQALQAQAAAEQRLFDGRLDDYARAARKAGAR